MGGWRVVINGGGGWFKNYEFNIMEVHWKNWFLGGGGGGENYYIGQDHLKRGLGKKGALQCTLYWKLVPGHFMIILKITV